MNLRDRFTKLFDSDIRASEFNRIELSVWFFYFAFWLIWIPVVLGINANHDWAIVILALLFTIPFVFLAVTMILYGLVAAAINIILFMLPRKIRWPISIVAVVIIAIYAPPYLERAAPVQAKEWMANDFQHPVGPPPKIITIVLPLSAKDDNGDPSQCGIYCQRLLYSGEAVIVQVGTMPADKPWDEVKNNLGSIKLTAYTINKGQSCVIKDLPTGRDSEAKILGEDKDITPLIHSRSATRECLSKHPGSWRIFGRAFVETRETTASTLHFTVLYLTRFLVIDQAGTGHIIKAQHTVVDYKPISRPMAFQISPSNEIYAYRKLHWEGYQAPERLALMRDMAGFTFNELQEVSIDVLRQAAIDEIKSKDKYIPKKLSSGTDNTTRVEDYIDRLNYNNMTKADYDFIDVILHERSLPLQVSNFRALMNRLDQRAARYAPYIIDEITSLDPDEYEWRIKNLASIFAELPTEIQKQYLDRLLLLAYDEKRRDLTYPVFETLRYAPASQALPAYVSLLKSPDGYSKSAGAMGLCHLGKDAAPAKEYILREAVQQPTYSLLAALYRLDAFDAYVAQRRARKDLDRISRQNDEQDFRSLPNQFKRGLEKGKDICRP